MAATKQLKRLTIAIAGGVVLLVGVALLVLPGPGLLLVLAGLLILASEFPALEKHVDPVRDRAMKAAEDSVASPLRIAGSVLAGLGLFAAGIVWGLVPGLPLGGWSTGSSLILSGIILFALLIWSYRRVQARRKRAHRRMRYRMWVAAGVVITRTMSSSTSAGSTSNRRRPRPSSTGMWWISISSSTPASMAVWATNPPRICTSRSPATAFACAMVLSIPSVTYVTSG